MRNIFIAISLGLFLYNCTDNVSESHYPTGSIKEKCEDLTDNGDRICQEFDSLGNLISLAIWKNARLVSRIDFFETGKVQLIRSFAKSKLTGHAVEFYPNGKTKYLLPYQKGLKKGWEYSFHEWGNLHIQRQWVRVDSLETPNYATITSAIGDTLYQSSLVKFNYLSNDTISIFDTLKANITFHNSLYGNWQVIQGEISPNYMILGDVDTLTVKDNTYLIEYRPKSQGLDTLWFILENYEYRNNIKYYQNQYLSIPFFVKEK